MGCELLYNSETGAILTRTPASWAKIGLFYFVYYTCLAAFFAGLLSVFLFGFTDNKAPLLTGSHSILPQNPGMGFRPMPDETKTMVKFSVKKADSFEPFVDNLDEFLNHPNKTNTYMKGQAPQEYRDCTKGAVGPASHDSLPCKYRIDDFKNVMDNCVNANFGYPDGKPCVVIKLNKIFEFVPELTDDGNELKFECAGEHSADKDNIGPIEYYPKQGVSMDFFPYLNQRGYLSPIVFVKFNNPVRGVLIQVACKPVNAQNIMQNKMSDGAGRVVFELLVDN